MTSGRTAWFSATFYVTKHVTCINVWEVIGLRLYVRRSVIRDYNLGQSENLGLDRVNNVESANERTNWTNERTNERTNEQTNKRTNERIKSVNERKNRTGERRAGLCQKGGGLVNL